jgi:hypothetical protein
MKLKFRVWIDSVNPPKMIYPDSITFHKDGSVETPEYLGGVVQQFTGIVDKNGVDLYEGDIIQNWMGFMGFIKRSPKTNSMVVCHNFTTDGCFIHSDAFTTIEMIGNIYETPYLLKK